MSTGKPFPHEDSKFNDYLHTAVPYLDTNWTRLVPFQSPPPAGSPSGAAAAVPADPRRAQLLTLYNNWNGIYTQAKSPNTRTTTITDNKNDLRSQIEALMRNIFKDIPDSWLTNADREALNIPQRHKPTHSHTPFTGFPEFTLLPQGGGDMQVKVRQEHDANRSSKPHGADIEFKWAFLPQDEPRHLTVDDLTNDMIATKSIFTLHCGPANIGKCLLAACRSAVVSSPARH